MVKEKTKCTCACHKSGAATLKKLGRKHYVDMANRRWSKTITAKK